MNLHKTVVVLLALLLAAMAMVPCVSAADEQRLSEQNAINDSKFTLPPEHHIPPEYFRDSKPATPLPESEMINIILSVNTLDKFTQDKQAGIISIPISYLNLNTQFTESKEYQNRFIENDINLDDTIVLVRMPKVMYDRFIETSKDGIIALPASYFSRYYKNLADLDSNIRDDGNALAIDFSDDPILAEKTNVSPSVNMKKVTQSTDRSGSNFILKHPQNPDTWHNEWIFFDRMYEADTYDYLIGQITPESWSISGNSDDFWAPQEREYYLNSGRQDAIEIVVNYDKHTNVTYPKVTFFPAVYDNNSSAPIPIGTWEDSGEGIITLTPGTFPDSYGYHVQISGGRYYITFQNMATLIWYDQYVYNDQDNPSTTFTEFAGSSEFHQMTSPITDTFDAETRPIDEWAHDATLSSWRKPVDVWEYSSAITGENFVDIYWFRSGANSDNIGTVSYLSSSSA
ncbi:MAG: hypothetical protein M0R30_05205 [Methanoregula sp.]|jgi:hypothetical protein|uniref:hypothetical protein n=1 Tax=Methanoregula sp. TaxID=2052170 RepID=UPI0025D5B898|nr:hypothetical protein [Methanoregula sp.]MCK9631021.1 hypothetical protein [Methanoregula sp.]